MPSLLDHLVVTGPSLEGASDFVSRALGCSPSGGGSHTRMGTHNRLLGTGSGTYLEAIAVDPQGSQPPTARWFGLDDVQHAGLRAWVARTTDIAAIAMTSDLGVISPMERGELRWQITVPRDGRVPLDGVAPALIQWSELAPSVAESPVRLISLTIMHPQTERVSEMLAGIDLVGPVTVQTDLGAGLVASFDTPQGPRFIGTDGLVEMSMERERQVAMDLFHATWRLLDLDTRTAEEAQAMVQCATASLWHWRHAGAATQWAIGEWQVSRVYAVLGDGVEALRHAQECLRIAESQRVDDFVPASAHESLARAHAILGDMEAARRERNLSYRIAVDLDDDDRDVIEHDLSTLPID